MSSQKMKFRYFNIKKNYGLLMQDEAFYDDKTLLHINTIYKDYCRLFDPPSTLMAFTLCFWNIFNALEILMLFIKLLQI